MLAQLRAVWMTYRTRKILWLPAAIYALLMFVMYMAPPRRVSILGPELETRWLPRQEFQGVTAFLNWNATDQELRELSGLKIQGWYLVEQNPIVDQSDTQSPSLSVDKPKRRQSLMVHDHLLTAEHLEKLGRCTGLRELRLLTVDLTPEVGAVLAKLQNLRVLELNLIGSPIPSLENLPALANLTTFRVPTVPPSDLGLLAKHPNLRLIELADHPAPKLIPGSSSSNKKRDRWSKPSTLHEATQLQKIIICPESEHMRQLAERVPYRKIPEAARSQTLPVIPELCEELSQLPNLTHVEVSDAGSGWPRTMVDDPGVRAALAGRRPAVKLNPFQSDTMGIGLILGGQCTLLIICFIGSQLVAQMGSAWSRVLPGYARPHLIVAFVFLATHIGIQTMFIIRDNKAALLPALAMATFLPAILSVVFAVVSRHLRLLPYAGFMPLILIGVILSAMPLFTPQRATAYLQGDNLMQSVVLLVVSLIAIIWSWRRWNELANSLSEFGIANGQGWFPFMQQLQMKNLAETEAKTKRKTSMPGRRWRGVWGMVDQHIEWVNSITDFSTTSARITRWRCGESTLRKRGIILIALCMPWLFCGIALGVFSFLSHTPFDLRKFIFHSVVAGPLIAPFVMWMLAIGMLARRPLLSQELLRPISRQEFNNDLKLSVWHDIWPGLLIATSYALCIPLVLPWAPKNWILSTPMIMSYLFYCAASVAFVWLGVLLTMTIQRTWLRMLLLISIGAVLPITFQFGAMTVVLGDRLFLTYGVVPVFLLGFFLVTGITGWFAFRRLPNVEWGR